MRFLCLSVITILVTTFGSSTLGANELMAELDGANQAFAKAILEKDIDHLVSDYTADACVLAPSAPRTCGLDAIRTFWTNVANSEPNNVQIETISAGSSGELAYATGILRITAADGESNTFNYVLVLKDVGGVWKLHLDTWTPQ